MKLFIYFLLLLLVIISTRFIPEVYAANPACPLPNDTKIYTDPTSGLCFSESDPLYNPGFNTTGGSISACGTNGQVQCPGGTLAGLSIGNVCVVQINGQCYAGHGPSGFNTPGCTQASATPLPKCPTPMNLSIHVVESTGKIIPPGVITFMVTYADAPPGNSASKTATAQNDPLGSATITGKLYSGDHFMIVPSSSYYTFSPSQIGSNTNSGDQEMNTIFSCGTTLENGTTRPLCQFTATRNLTLLPTAPPVNPPNAPQTPQYTDNTVNDTTTSLIQTMSVLTGVGLVGYFVMTLGGSGKL